MNRAIRPQPLHAVRRPSAKAGSSDRELCVKCGRTAARVVGRSESFPVAYLRCDDCRQMTVAPA